MSIPGKNKMCFLNIILELQQLVDRLTNRTFCNNFHFQGGFPGRKLTISPNGNVLKNVGVVDRISFAQLIF